MTADAAPKWKSTIFVVVRSGRFFSSNHAAPQQVLHTIYLSVIIYHYSSRYGPCSGSQPCVVGGHTTRTPCALQQQVLRGNNDIACSYGPNDINNLPFSPLHHIANTMTTYTFLLPYGPQYVIIILKKRKRPVRDVCAILYNNNCII